MILLPCPWCGPRNVAEFRYIGEAIARPEPAATTPDEWRRYLYMRGNPSGPLRESWYHTSGCRRYFTVQRDTLTNVTAGDPHRGDSHEWGPSQGSGQQQGSPA
jgi:sarcosine oxidase subunit delta